VQNRPQDEERRDWIVHGASRLLLPGRSRNVNKRNDLSTVVVGRRRHDLARLWIVMSRKRRFSSASILLLALGMSNIWGATSSTTQKTLQQSFVKYHKSLKVRMVPKLVFATYGRRRLVLDLYLPISNGQNRPGVVVIRGGGWMVGDRKRFAHIASGLAELGVASACIEYRTADKAAFPAAIQDVKAAVRWMRANAKQYGIDPQVIGTMGG